MEITDDNQFIQIVKTFSKKLGVSLCIYDYSEKLNLPNFLTTHCQDFCTAAKKDITRQLKCTECDIQLTKHFLADKGTPFKKICHQDVMEIIYPIIHHRQLIGIICIGLFQYKKNWNPENTFVQKKIRSRHSSYLDLKEKLPYLDEKEEEDILLLVQLLELKIHKYLDNHTNQEAGSSGHKGIIARFFQKNFTGKIQIQDLANELHLSESRTTQLLKKHFNKTYPQLLKFYRMEYAKSLLENTLYPVIKISKICGYSDQGYFHRNFKSTTKLTPKAYRKKYMDSSIQEA